MHRPWYTGTRQKPVNLFDGQAAVKLSTDSHQAVWARIETQPGYIFHIYPGGHKIKYPDKME